MQISQHYLPYTKRTLLIITNNELAKLLEMHEREITEISTLQMPVDDTDVPRSGSPNAPPADIDELKRHRRVELYKKLSIEIQKHLKKGFEQVILCAPEANKNELSEAMHADVTAAVVETVPKNLASLPLDAVVRILQETRMT